MSSFLRQNSLTLFFLTILLVALVGQSVAGLAEFNAQQTAAGLEQLSYAGYLTSSDFATDVAENWQSEFLQFTLYILATVYLVQRGSSESKEPDKAGLSRTRSSGSAEFAKRLPAWARARGWRPHVYSRSLRLVMAAIFTASWVAQSVAGRAAYNAPAAEPAAGPGELVGLRHVSRLLEPHPAELAVGVPRGRLDGCVRRVPAATRVAGVQAGRHVPPQHRHAGVSSRVRQRAAVQVEAGVTRGWRGRHQATHDEKELS